MVATDIIRASSRKNLKEAAMNQPIYVLLVDDEEQFVVNMARLLKFRGFDVVTAPDGNTALKTLANDGPFDVVILDIKMPGMSGLTALAEIKKVAPQTEVIMLTGHATVESGIESIRNGAFDYLMKPCEVELLADKIREACEVERIRQRPVLWPRNLVKEITWPSFIKLYADDPADKALDVFKRRSGAPAKENLYVLDADDRFAGTVNRQHLLDAARRAHPQNQIEWKDLVDAPACLRLVTLAEIMRTDYPITTDPEENLTAVAQRMIENNIRAMPVVENEKVKGFIRLQDIFKYVEQETI
jgi:two-component system, NtrC family, response regulator HydG